MGGFEDGGRLLHAVGRVLGGVGAAADDLVDGHVRPQHEAHEADQADEDVLGHHQRGHALPVEGQDLQDGGEDERQEAAADRAHQGDDQVQHGDEDGQRTCTHTHTHRLTGWKPVLHLCWMGVRLQLHVFSCGFVRWILIGCWFRLFHAILMLVGEAEPRILGLVNWGWNQA